MDGLEFVRRVRGHALQQVRRVPILLLTGGKAPDLPTKAELAGVSEFVRKPISIDALTTVVRRHLVLPEDVGLVA